MFSYQLHDGSAIPGLAFGLYLVKDGEETESIVKKALEVGYRHFDGASFYNNERSFGKALKYSNISESEIFYTTKVWTTDSTHDAAVASIKKSVSLVGFPVNLALVHWPVPVDIVNQKGHIEMYKGLQTAYKLGLVKNIGLSNYSIADYEELMSSGIVTVQPVVNQIESSPLLYRQDVVTYFQSRGIIIQAFKPLLRGNLITDHKIISMARKYNLTAAAIGLLWCKQKQLNILCKTLNFDHLVENFNIVNSNICITPEDMEQLDQLTTEEALTTAKAHYLQRRVTTAAPWGLGTYAEQI